MIAVTENYQRKFYQSEKYMNITILKPIAERLLRTVRIELKKEAIERKIPIPKTEDKFWGMIDPKEGIPLFNVIIDRSMSYKTLYKKFYEKSKSVYIDEESREEYFGWTFQSRTIESAMRFLKCSGSNVFEQFRSFCEMNIENENENEKVKESDISIQFGKIWSSQLLSTRKEKTPVRADIHDWLKTRANFLRMTYAPFLCNTDWWLYFYGYDKLNLKRKKGTWDLIKLLFRFGEIKDGEIEVTIDNTDTPEHYDYIGSTDFSKSQAELLVFNFVTHPQYTRQLNMKIHVGIGEGTLFLGQFLNYENDGNIISGTIVLESAKSVPAHLRKAKVHYVPLLRPGDRYIEPFEGVSPYILQYLHDKGRNFRRTPLRAGHSLQGLKNWLEARAEEDKFDLSDWQQGYDSYTLE